MRPARLLAASVRYGFMLGVALVGQFMMVLDTKEGRFMFAVLAAAAEYELELRAERQAEGIAAAKRREAEGRMLPGKKKIGRPAVLGPAELATLRRLVDEGASVTEAARTLKIGRSTAYAALAER